MATVYALRNSSIIRPAEKTRTLAYPDGRREDQTILEPAFLNIAKGQSFNDDDPIVLSHPDLFTNDARRALPGAVEQATAAPGEKRNARRAG